MTDVQPFPSQDNEQEYSSTPEGAYFGPHDAPDFGGEPPLSQPYYGASLPAAVRRFFTRAIRFKGRSSRSEFWWVALVIFVIAVILDAAITATGNANNMSFALGTIQTAFFLILLVPHAALTWRRLHDAGFPGPFWFLSFVPIIGWIALLVMTVMPSRPEKMKVEWDDKENSSQGS
ncbi:DUF805 domain-containing protein [Corynebacterium kroppenstedtii]|uniref:DUF805 domain-containing protein n=1 Tax=Corynebacterium sp. PCR 32 TaxID=3351342 RepID=UPI0030A6953C